MAFGSISDPTYLPTTHISSEIESPTDVRTLMAPYQGDPRQMLAFLQHPQTQAMLQRFGIPFDQNLLRESPFLPQSFMQQHPMLGRGLTSAMGGAMSVPEAPMVSGAGSGIQRALMGAMGGPEVARQYQRQQLQGPLQQLGMMIAPMEFERKQQLLSSWQKMMESSEEGRQAAERLAEQAEQDKANRDFQQQQLALQKFQSQRPVVTPYGIESYKEGQQGQPGWSLQGGQAPTPGGWQFQPWGAIAPQAPYYPGKPAPKGVGRSGLTNDQLILRQHQDLRALEDKYNRASAGWSPTPPPQSGYTQDQWNTYKNGLARQLEQEKQQTYGTYNSLWGGAPPPSAMAPAAGGEGAPQGGGQAGGAPEGFDPQIWSQMNQLGYGGGEQ